MREKEMLLFPGTCIKPGYCIVAIVSRQSTNGRAATVKGYLTDSELSVFSSEPGLWMMYDASPSSGSIQETRRSSVSLSTFLDTLPVTSVPSTTKNLSCVLGLRMILAVLAPRLMMKSTSDVDLLNFGIEFSIFVKFLIRHKGLPPTQKIAGEQNNRTLTECKTHNFLTGMGGINF
jgi:hypothetical protein